MRVWVDIPHLAELNFYMNAIKILSEENEVIVTVLDRGNLYHIAKKELNETKLLALKKLGKHRGSKISVIFEANLLKLFKSFYIHFRYKPDFVISNDIYSGIVAKLLKKKPKILLFGDDIERELKPKIKSKLTDECYFAVLNEEVNDNRSFKTFNASKEWGYLSPKYFEPNSAVLDQYSVEPKKYIFVREVITGTYNYNGQQSNIIGRYAGQFPKEYRVLLSLEDKSTRDLYPDDWILLEEPLEDIHSLIYYSRLLVSSGDSMAREAGMLGVSSIYCGMRTMNANQPLIEKGILHHAFDNKMIEELQNLINNDKINQENFREELQKSWEDPTALIINKFEEMSKK